MSMLEVRGLAVGYGKVAVLGDARLDVGSGRIVTVIGPNGAGKTTLLAALMGLLPARGSVRYDGEDLADLSVEARVRRGMCLVPERRELFGEMPVEDNLRLGAFSRLLRNREAEDDLAAVYARFPRLQERRAQLADTLSGGERQMLALGRALMARPKLLMLDEPSLGLAPRIARDIFHVIAGLRQTGVSILLVEQNARAALQVADYGYVLEMGEFVLEGPAAELAVNPRVVETYLGLAATRRINRRSARRLSRSCRNPPAGAARRRRCPRARRRCRRSPRRRDNRSQARRRRSAPPQHRGWRCRGCQWPRN